METVKEDKDMVRQEIFSGKTVEEAVEEGLAAMKLKREDAEIEVLEEGKKKLIGKALSAQVRITEKEKASDAARSVKFLEGLFSVLKIEARPEIAEENEKIVIKLDVETTRGVIGRRGEIIDAIQILAGAVANTGRKEYIRVVVDCGNYREEREETLRRVAQKMAAKAVRTGKRMRLEPMNPYERRIIHSALADNEEVTTKSEGNEPARFVVIMPKNRKPFNRNDRDKRGGRGGRNFDRNGRGRFEKKPYPKRELPEEGTPESSGTSFKPRESSFKKGGFSGFFGTYLGNEDDATPTDEE